MPGLTVDKFDIGIYIQYARRTELLEQVRQQLHLPEAGTVPAQALIVDLYPKLAEMDLLMGVAALHAPWAYFYPPNRFSAQRRTPFAFHKIIPIFGTQESEAEEVEKLDAIECSSAQEQEEKEILKNCFGNMRKINDLLHYIGGRIGQFLQG